MIRIALIGAGRIGAMHARNLKSHPAFELAAVFDMNTEAAQAAAGRSAEVAVAANAAEIFSDDTIDAVLIASLTNTHCDYISAAAQTGKAVLCEKPIDLDIARVDQCRDGLGASPPPIQIGFNRRYDPGHAALRERLRQGEIGSLEKLIITSRDPGVPSEDYLKNAGGLFRDMMIHDFDLARSLLPEEPQRIVATGTVLIAPGVCGSLGDVDTAMVIMQTASGVLCHINCSRRAVYGYDQRVEAFGEGGMLISDNNTATSVRGYNAQATAAREPLPHFFIERYADAYRLQLDAFARAVQEGLAPSPSFEDGRRALMLAQAAAESLHSGGWTDLRF